MFVVILKLVIDFDVNSLLFRHLLIRIILAVCELLVIVDQKLDFVLNLLLIYLDEVLDEQIRVGFI